MKFSQLPLTTVEKDYHWGVFLFVFVNTWVCHIHWNHIKTSRYSASITWSWYHFVHVSYISFKTVVNMTCGRIWSQTLQDFSLLKWFTLCTDNLSKLMVLKLYFEENLLIWAFTLFLSVWYVYSLHNEQEIKEKGKNWSKKLSASAAWRLHSVVCLSVLLSLSQVNRQTLTECDFSVNGKNIWNMVHASSALYSIILLWHASDKLNRN